MRNHPKTKCANFRFSAIISTGAVKLRYTRRHIFTFDLLTVITEGNFLSVCSHTRQKAMGHQEKWADKSFVSFGEGYMSLPVHSQKTKYFFRQHDDLMTRLACQVVLHDNYYCGTWQNMFACFSATSGHIEINQWPLCETYPLYNISKVNFGSNLF